MRYTLLYILHVCLMHNKIVKFYKRCSPDALLYYITIKLHNFLCAITVWWRKQTNLLEKPNEQREASKEWTIRLCDRDQPSVPITKVLTHQNQQTHYKTLLHTWKDAIVRQKKFHFHVSDQTSNLNCVLWCDEVWKPVRR